MWRFWEDWQPRPARIRPDALVDAFLQGLEAELRKTGSLNSFDGGGPTVEDPSLEEDYAKGYYDEISGVLLDPRKVKEVRGAEVEYMHKMNV